MTGIPFSEQEVLSFRLGLMTHFSRPVPTYVAKRRIVQKPGCQWWRIEAADKSLVAEVPCPFRVGSEYFVKEAWRVRGGPEYEYQRHRPSVVYRESADTVDQVSQEWKSALSMKQWAARFTLTVRDIRAIRLLEIDEATVKLHGYPDARAFLVAWDARYRDKGAESRHNPYVWMVEFEPFALLDP